MIGPLRETCDLAFIVFCCLLQKKQKKEKKNVYVSLLLITWGPFLFDLNKPLA